MGRKSSVPQDLAERRQVDESLARSHALLAAISQAQSSVIEEADPHDVFDAMLQELLKLTGSEYGFMGEVLHTPEGRPYLKTYTLTDIAWSPEMRQLYSQRVSQGLEFCNLDTLFGAVITSGRVVLANDPANDRRRGGLPPGHPPLSAFMGLPFHSGDRLVGMLGLANRPGGYDEELVGFLQPLLVTCATLIDAFRNHRRQQLAEEELRRSAEEIHDLYNTAPCGYHSLDARGVVVRINDTELDWLGYSRAEVVGCMSFTDLLTAESARRFEQSARRLGAQGRVGELELEMVRRDGSTLFVVVSDSAVTDAAGAFVMSRSTVFDVTQRKRLEEQLLQAQKMEAVGQLGGGVAHDFNNIVTVIMGRIHQALFELPLNSPVRVQLEETLRVTERAAALTRQLLAFARRQVFEPRVVDPNQLIGNVGGMMRRLIGEDIELVTRPAPDLGCVKVDPGQLEQVLVNLAVNARDAMPAGGTLTVCTSNLTLDDPAARQFVGVNPGNYVMVSVSDTGVGMTEETRQHAFEPFFTTKGHGRGTGLGLATCFGIVHQAGGYISFESEPGRGTTFSILLPRVLAEPVSSDTPTDSLDLPEGTETILLAEDDPDLRSLLSSVLGGKGYTVVQTGDGLEALAEIQRRGEEIDLMLSDVVMPGLSGHALVERVARLHPQIKVILISGYVRDETARAAPTGPGVHFMQKPFTTSQLARTVRQVLDAQ